MSACEKENYNLPYGEETCLHESIIDKIMQLYEMDGLESLIPLDYMDAQGDDFD